MFSSLLFGNVFRYNEQEFIFLTQTESIVYAAKILGKDQSSRLESLSNRKAVKNKPTDLPLYCYVMLKTEEFRNRCAHMGNVGKDAFALVSTKLDIVLDPEDLKNIKEEIRSSKAVPKELKKLVEDISV